MSALDILSMCLRNLLKRKLRTLLTMLGVIIGTAALILTISLGLASEARFQRMEDEMGMDMSAISVSVDWTRVQTWTQDGPVLPDGVPGLDDQAIQTIERIPGVRFVSPRMTGQLFLRTGPYQLSWWNVNFVGMRPEAIELSGVRIAEGRFMEPGDTNAAIFGASAEMGFERANQGGSGFISWTDTRIGQWQMGEEVETLVDVMNAPILASVDQRFIWQGFEEVDFDEAFRPISQFTLNVVGVAEPQEQRWSDTNIFMDIEDLLVLDQLRRETERELSQDWGEFSARDGGARQSFDELFVMVDDPSQTSGVAEIIDGMGFMSSYASQGINMMRESQSIIENLLIGVAAVSIFVAAISIANTMIMAVYERTREIGVMKVIGGAVRDIRRMFLLEAALIGLIGGMIGVILSLLASYFLNNAGLGILTDQQVQWWWMEPETPVDQTSLITPWLCGVALVFASVVGLISGYFPARRATKLSALAAIRTD